jgi:hypothetical protein
MSVMRNSTCPHCGQRIPPTRLGVRLTPLKARVFDLIEGGGADGIATEDVKTILGMSTSCFKSHVHQINELIEDEGFRIRASRGRGAVIRLVRAA